METLNWKAFKTECSKKHSCSQTKKFSLKTTGKHLKNVRIWEWRLQILHQATRFVNTLKCLSVWGHLCVWPSRFSLLEKFSEDLWNLELFEFFTENLQTSRRSRQMAKETIESKASTSSVSHSLFSQNIWTPSILKREYTPLPTFPTHRSSLGRTWTF